MVGTRVFVGNLPSETNERDLERFFRGYGRMREVLLKNGYGFVEFEDYRDAEDAVYELNGKKLLGVRVTVEKARGTPRGRDQYYARDRDYPSRDYNRTRNDRYGPPTRTAHRLIVENLSSRVSWQDLKDFMRQAGEVTYADAHKKRRNEGVVEFASSTDMRNALDKYDNYEINGRRIRLVEDKDNKRHSSRSSSYSSRSRSPRKSRSSSRSRSPKKSKSRSASRKKSADRSRSNSHAKSDNRRSRSNSRPKSEVRDRSRSRSKERSTSRRPKSEVRSRSRSAKRDGKSSSRSRHDSRERSRSRSRSRHTRSRSHEDN